MSAENGAFSPNARHHACNESIKVLLSRPWESVGISSSVREWQIGSAINCTTCTNPTPAQPR